MQFTGFERELFRAMDIVRVSGLKQEKGVFIITAKEVKFTPSPQVFPGGGTRVAMKDISRADASSMTVSAGLTPTVSVYTVSGKKHVFALAAGHDARCRTIADIINTHKGMKIGL